MTDTTGTTCDLNGSGNCGTGNTYEPTVHVNSGGTDTGTGGTGTDGGSGGGGITGTTSVSEILDKLSGYIEFTHLASTLRQRIAILDNIPAGLTNLKSLVHNDNEVLSRELLALRNDLTNAMGYIEELNSIIVDETKTLVSTVKTLVAQNATGLTAALREESSVRAEQTGALFGEKVIKIDLDGNIAGYGLSAYRDPTGKFTSDFRVASNTFSIAPATYNSYYPPAVNLRFDGFVWQDMSAFKADPVTGENVGTTKWWNEFNQTWQLTPVKAAQPFTYLTTPTVMSDGTVIKPGLYVNNAAITHLTADRIDSRGLAIKDESGNTILGAGEKLNWNFVTGTGRPEDGATRGAPIGTLVGGVKVEFLTEAVTNYNKSNDRNPAAITVPTASMASLQHAEQTDASVDISFEWGWSGVEKDIDGFFVYVYQHPARTDDKAPTIHTFGTDVYKETVYTLPAGKRAFIVYGTAADKYYTFGVQAYRAVDADINSSGIIRTTIKTVGPYRPKSTIAFSGNVIGTIDGLSANTLVQGATAAYNMADQATKDVAAVNKLATDIGADNKFTGVEKQSARVAWNSLVREMVGIVNQAIGFNITTVKDAYVTAAYGLGYYLNGGSTAIDFSVSYPLWINDTNITLTTDINGTTFRDMWVAFYEKRQTLMNEIAKEAAKRADWSSVSGTGKPQNNADVTANSIAKGIAGQGALATKSWVNVGETVKFPDGTVMNTGDFINKLSKIGTNNISTFMESAAIGNAYIGNAAVKTLNIDGNAVVVPSGSIGTYAASVTISMDFPGVVAVIGTFTQGGGKNRHAWRVTMNGSTLQAENPIEGTLGSITTGAYVPAGVHTFGISCDTPTGDGRCGIIVLGIKR